MDTHHVWECWKSGWVNIWEIEAAFSSSTTSVYRAWRGGCSVAWAGSENTISSSNGSPLKENIKEFLSVLCEVNNLWSLLVPGDRTNTHTLCLWLDFSARKDCFSFLKVPDRLIYSTKKRSTQLSYNIQNYILFFLLFSLTYFVLSYVAQYCFVFPFSLKVALFLLHFPLFSYLNLTLFLPTFNTKSSYHLLWQPPETLAFNKAVHGPEGSTCIHLYIWWYP